MGSGPFTFVQYEKGSYWEGKRFDGYFRKGLPHLDGYKAYFVKSNGVVPGILGGQFDAEFRSRNPSERDQLLAKMKDQLVLNEGPFVGSLMVVFNTKRKPFDDIRVRQALSLAIDRWGGSPSLAKISILKHVGGFMRPGFSMALPEAELVKLPGFSKDIEASRAQARKLLKEAGAENLTFKLFNRNVAEPYTPGGVFVIDQWRRIGVNVQHEQLETKAYQDGVLSGNFDVAIEFIVDFTDDPTAQFSKLLTKKASPTGFSGHEDTKLDEMYEKQRRAHRCQGTPADRAAHGSLRDHDGLQRAAALVSAHHRQSQEDPELGLLAQPVHPAGPERGVAGSVGGWSSWALYPRSTPPPPSCRDPGAMHAIHRSGSRIFR